MENLRISLITKKGSLLTKLKYMEKMIVAKYVSPHNKINKLDIFSVPLAIAMGLVLLYISNVCIYGVKQK